MLNDTVFTILFILRFLIILEKNVKRLNMYILFYQQKELICNEKIYKLKPNTFWVICLAWLCLFSILACSTVRNTLKTKILKNQQFSNSAYS